MLAVVMKNSRATVATKVGRRLTWSVGGRRCVPACRLDRHNKQRHGARLVSDSPSNTNELAAAVYAFSVLDRSKHSGENA
jgi:hypothetical protein